MNEKKSSSSVWWPKRVFNWSNTSATDESEKPNETKDLNIDGLSCISSESQDMFTNNNKYVNLLLKRIRKQFKMSGDEDRIGWMSDSNAKQCYECGEKFTTLRRRHHCRICGQIFCTKCCDEEIDGKLLGLSSRGSVRSCNYCHKIVYQYISDRNSDTNSLNRDSEFNQFREILLSKRFTEDLNVDQNDFYVPTRSADHMISNPTLSPHSAASFRRKSSLVFREEEYAKPKTSLVLDINPEAMNQLSGSCPSPLHSFSSFGSYKTIVKSIDDSDEELMPLRGDESTHEPLWVKEINEYSNSFEKIKTSSELLDSTCGNSFPKESKLRQTKGSVSPTRRMAYSNSTYDIELDFEKDRVSISKAGKIVNSDDNTSDTKQTSDGLSVDFEVTATSADWEPLKEGTEEKSVYDSLNSNYNQLYNKLLKQFLEDEGLSLGWLNVIQKISSKVSSVVRPNTHNDVEEMDVRNYVKMKTIPNGVKNDCQIINGVVFSKNVSNRKMRQTITHPKILLLSCSIVYQRYEKKLTVFDTILLQENEYINNLIAKICSYGPDVILVEKPVARIAKELLLENNITLICNVKPVIIERISRFTGAAIVTSLDAQIGVPQLGICQKFYLQTFNQKTLMYFDGCPQHMGCTVLLRGGTEEELKKIKNITSFMVYCDYNWQLERSFLMDEYCYPNESVDSNTDPNSDSNDSQTKNSLSNEKSVSSVVDDNSDPLRSMATDINPNDILSPTDVKAFKASDENEDNFSELTTKLRYFLSKLQLSCSPFLTIPLPYLMTNSANNSKLRKFFTPDIIWSKRFATEDMKKSELLKVDDSFNRRNIEQSSPNEVIPYKIHPFLTRSIKIPTKSQDIKSLIADFRANGPFIYEEQKQLEELNNKKNTSEEVTKSVEQTLRIDSLDPKLHQHLGVLFSSFSYASTNAPNYCVKPWIINMDFYGCNDIPLGGFLERYCFRPSYTCPSNTCATPMIEHVRRFVHSNGCVLIVLRQLQHSVDAANNSIITWSWCQKCKTGTPYSNLSSDSWSLSFAKYLELKFYGIHYKRRSTSSSVACLEHSLHTDHFQFFAYKQVVASFKYVSVQIHEIALPPTRLVIDCNVFCKNTFIEDLKQIAIKGYEIYASIHEKLCSVKDETIGSKYEIIVKEFLTIEDKERQSFRQNIEEIQLTLTSSDCQHIDGKTVHKLEDSLIQLKKLIAESVHSFNAKIQEFIANKKKDEKLLSKSGTQTTVPTIIPKTLPISAIPIEEMNENLDDMSPNSRTLSISSVTSLLSSMDAMKADNYIEEQKKECEETLKALENIIIDKSVEETPDLEAPDIRDREGTTISVSSYGYDIDIGINNCLENAVDFDSNSDNYAVYTIHDSNNELKKPEDNQSVRSSTNLSVISESKSMTQTSAPKPDSAPFTVKRIFRELLTNANNLTINNPFPLSEHYILPTLRENIAVVVKDDDPGSIISYAMTSYEYERQMADLLRLSSSPVTKRKLTVSTEVEVMTESLVSKVSTNELSKHIDIQYNDANAKFYCCVYFAEQFRRFRANIFDSSFGEELYIRSLTSCIPWKARGGKSGSMFCKTINDRFILKEMSKLELQSFLNIANYYFDYCTTAIDDSRPTLLARIVGVYRTSYKNTATNNASKLYLLVMENLFYKCNISQKFDLKGSMRNRLVNTNSPNLKADQIVLLDENLMQMTCDCPLYVHSHSKAILRAAIDNDSQFLSSHSVMDYSLLVGIEDQKNEFVVGIIDYIRPFTWDKKIESVVKSVGSQGKLPTIVQPDLYRIRFCEAMDQYFLCVPDKWYSIVDYN